MIITGAPIADFFVNFAIGFLAGFVLGYIGMALFEYAAETVHDWWNR